MKIDNVTASSIAEQCQRNWNQNKKVSDEHINEIICQPSKIENIIN